MMAHCWWYLVPSLTLSKKIVVGVGPPLAKLSGSAHGCYVVVKYMCKILLRVVILSL